MMKGFGILLFGLICASRAFGQVSSPVMLLVSDIDDTIKVSHVLNKFESVVNAPRADNLLLGMPQLFLLLQSRNPNLKIAYLSNAIESISGKSHAKLLQSGKFPAGTLLLRKSPRDDEHKIKTLRELVQRYQPQGVILFGDNGERDPLIYDQFRREFPRLPMVTFVRQMYSTQDKKRTGARLYVGQVGFVTAVEPVLDLIRAKVLATADLQWMIDNVVPEILQRADYEDHSGRRGGLFMPRWQDCRDFSWGMRAGFLAHFRVPGLDSLKNRLLERCSQPPLFDK